MREPPSARLGVLSIGLMLVGGLVPSPSNAHADRKPGRVVRVERPTNRRIVKPQACMFAQATPGPSATLTCVGKRTYRSGEAFTLLSEDGAHARLVVEGTSPSTVDSCNLGYAFDVDVRVEDMILGANSQGFSQKMAVRGLETIARVSKTIATSSVGPSPSGQSTDNVVLAIDRGGDGAADFLVVLSACRPAQINKPWVTPGQQWHREND